MNQNSHAHKRMSSLYIYNIFYGDLLNCGLIHFHMKNKYFTKEEAFVVVQEDPKVKCIYLKA